MRTRARLIAIVAAALFSVVASAAEKGKDKFVINATDDIRSILAQEIDLPVKLKLRSGAEVGGTVTRLGNGIVQISQVTGMELYDAIVKIDDISAVLFWVRKR